MGEDEVIVSYGPRNNFQDYLTAVLNRSAIPAKILAFAEVATPDKSNYPDNPGYEPYVVIVLASQAGEANAIVQNVIHDAKICTQCDSFAPSENFSCPHCGALLDPRTPDEIRADYVAELRKHT